MSQTITGYYKSTYIGGVLYRVYYQASKLTDHLGRLASTSGSAGTLVHSYSANLANTSSWDYFAVTS